MHRTCRGRTLTWQYAGLAALSILAGIVVGCAATPTGMQRTMKEGDFKMLAGKWTGSLIQQQATSIAIEGVIQEDGSFYIVQRGAPGAQMPGKMKIVDGGVVYEAATSKGTMTFHESDNVWLWKWNGKTVDGSTVRNELTKSK